MARMRYVKPEFWTDGKMVKLSRDARLLFIGMWNFALCDKGHVEDDVLRLKMQIFPADDVDTASLLGELMGSRRVVRLESTNGDTYLHVVHLGDHQKVDPRWTPRCAACKDSPNLSEAPQISPVLTEPLRNSPEPSGTLRNSLQEGIGGEGIGEERMGGVTHSSAPDPKPAAEPRGFTDFWAAYPKRTDKGHARSAWAKAVRSANMTDILDGARRFAADPNLPEPKYIPMPSTWLNGERWRDGPLPSRHGRPVDRQAELLRSEMERALAADAQNQLEIGA